MGSKLKKSRGEELGRKGVIEGKWTWEGTLKNGGAIRKRKGKGKEVCERASEGEGELVSETKEDERGMGCSWQGRRMQGEVSGRRRD